jgi:hypothetical protein
VDERVAIYFGKDFFKVKIEREIPADKCLVCPNICNLSAILPAPDHIVTDNPAPPAIPFAIPAEYLSAPKRLVKRERLVFSKGNLMHENRPFL